MLRRIGILAAVLFAMAVGASGQLKEGDGAYKVTIPVKDKLSMHGVRSRYLVLYTVHPDSNCVVVGGDYNYSAGTEIVLQLDSRPLPWEYELRVDVMERIQGANGKIEYRPSENYESKWLRIEVPDSATYPYEMPPLVMDYVPMQGLE